MCNEFKTLNAHSKSVFVAILSKFIRDGKGNPENLIQMSHNDIERLSGESHSSVVRAIKELKERNFIRTKIAGGLGNGRSTMQINGFYLQIGQEDARWREQHLG